MRLNRFSDYSLRVLLYLASVPDGRATIAEVAGAYGVSEHHLVKVVHFLGKAGLLANTRGHGGGLRLARAPSEINVGAVVRLAEGGDVPAECFDSAANRCPIAGGCGLQRVLGEAVESFYSALGRHTLADLPVHRRKRQVLFQRRAA
jgi:Rrf2 family transcriptional regulator, nitric oxide-sensitive transcriptional repressor